MATKWTKWPLNGHTQTRYFLSFFLANLIIYLHCSTILGREREGRDNLIWLCSWSCCFVFCCVFVFVGQLCVHFYQFLLSKTKTLKFILFFTAVFLFACSAKSKSLGSLMQFNWCLSLSLSLLLASSIDGWFWLLVRWITSESVFAACFPFTQMKYQTSGKKFVRLIRFSRSFCPADQSSRQ